MPDDGKAPSRWKLLGEMRALGTLFRSRDQGVPPLAASNIGAGRPVLVLPGFLATDDLLGLLHRTLAISGYRPFASGLGPNLGARPDTLDRLVERLDRVRGQAGAPVAVVGWSLGGLYARELARARPGQVDLVITLGTPFAGDLARATNLRALYNFISDYNIGHPQIPYSPAKPPVRTIALWSRNDGVVAPASARGEPGQADEQVELGCTHVGFVTEAEPLRRLVALLAP